MRDDLFIAVRNNSLDVYYRGGSIFQIRDAGNGTVKPNTHVRYLVRQEEARVELDADNKFMLPPEGLAWERYEGDKTLSDMLTAAQTLAGLEKSGLHPLVVGSPNVIDVEISLRASHPLPDQSLSVCQRRAADKMQKATTGLTQRHWSSGAVTPSSSSMRPSTSPIRI